MDREFKVGEQVRLKSGGPVMTIENIGNYPMGPNTGDSAKCVWFDGTKKSEGLFAPATLCLADSDEPESVKIGRFAGRRSR